MSKKLGYCAPMYLSKPFLLCIQPTSRATPISLPHPIHQLPVGRQCGCDPQLAVAQTHPRLTELTTEALPCDHLLTVLQQARHTFVSPELELAYTVELEQVEAVVFLKDRICIVQMYL